MASGLHLDEIAKLVDAGKVGVSENLLFGSFCVAETCLETCPLASAVGTLQK